MEKTIIIRKDYNYFLDSLKGICMILIVLTHCCGENRLTFMLGFPFWVDMAVPILMIISGYVYALQYTRNNIQSFSDAYELKNWIGGAIKYTIPFGVVYFLELIYSVLHYPDINLISAFYGFLYGGTAPGSYYYPIMMQFIFVFPAIFFCIKKYKDKGVLVCGIVNLSYEILKTAYGMNEGCYRLLIFRYILLISVGCYLASEEFILKKKALIGSFMMGAAFIVVYRYFSVQPVIFIYWTGTSMMAGLFVVPMAILLILKFSNVRWKLLEIFGKASYNIFIVQMMYYKYLHLYIKGRIPGLLGQLLVSMMICLSAGLIYYYIEFPCTKVVIKKIKSKI